MTDYKQLCAELIAAWDNLPWQYNWKGDCIGLDGYAPDEIIVERVRAELANPEPEGPTDEEILELMPQQFRDDLATVSRLAAHGAGPDIKPGLFRVSLNAGALDFARAVFARWGK